MLEKRNITLYIIAGIVGLVILFFLTKFIRNHQVSSEIPDISDSQTLSKPVKEQIVAAVEKAHRHPTAENLGNLGMIYHSSANYTQAGKCYELAVKRKKSDWIWNYYQGYLNVEMGKSEAAIENFNRVIQKNPNVDLARYYIGEEYKNLGKNDLAEESFRKIIDGGNKTSSSESSTRRDHFPLKTYAMYELARIYIDSGRNELAEKTLKELIQKYYLYGPAYRLLGNIYNAKGNKSLGDKYTIRASDLVSFSPPVDTLVDKLALTSRSELYLLRKIDEAERSIYSDWTLRLVNHGLKYMPDNKYLISKAIKIYLWKKQNEKAVALIGRHINTYGDSFSEMNNTGNLFFIKGLFPEAVKYWVRAAELDSTKTEIRKNLAKGYWAAGEKQKSYQILNKVIANNQNNPDILADFTYLLLHFGEKERAVRNLIRLKRIAPSNPKVQKVAAEIAKSNGQIQRAINLYESSFKGDPEDLQTIRSLGDLLMEEEMWGKYSDLCREALEYHPNDPELLGRLGEFLINCPDPDYRNIEEGKEYAERAFTFYDCPPEILVSAGSHLAYAYAMMGNRQRAITTITQAINIGRAQNVPSSDIKKLENFYNALQKMKTQ